MAARRSWGAVLGAFVVNWAKSGLSEQFPSFWTYFLGLMFIVVIAYAPQGLAGFITSTRDKVKEKKRDRGIIDSGPPEPASEGAVA